MQKAQVVWTTWACINGGEGVRRNRIFEGFQSSPIIALTQRHTRKKHQNIYPDVYRNLPSSVKFWAGVWAGGYDPPLQSIAERIWEGRACQR